MSEEKLDELKSLLVIGAKSIFQKGLVENNEGNVSVRVGKADEYLITPTANQYDQLTKEQIVHMSFDGVALSSGKLPSSEVKLHVALYKSRPKVQCVIHTHSTFATMLSVVRKNIPIIMEEQVVYLGGSIDVSSYGEAHTDDIGSVAVNALGYKNAALLANHGVIACGKSVNNAVKSAELVEKLAKVYWGTLILGNPYTLEEENLDKFFLMFKQLFATAPRSMLK